MNTIEPNHFDSENEENLQLRPTDPKAAPVCNTHFVLAIVAICTSCLTGFFSIPLAIAALIFSLRAQDQLAQNQIMQARKTAFWAAVFGWTTLGFLLLPILVIFFFGGALLALWGAMAHAL